jgi:bacteriorhodopsin
MRLTNLPSSELDSTSKLRFICLIGVHGILILTTLAVAFCVQGLYKHATLQCATCLAIVLAISYCESVVHKIENDPFYNYRKNDRSYESI